MKLLKKNKGFTVVELVIVIGVIAVLSAILIPTFVNVTENAKKSAAQADCRTAYSQYVLEANDNIHDDISDETHKYYLAYVKEEKVELERSGVRYHYEDQKGWVAGALPGADFVAEDGHEGFTNYANDAAKLAASTFEKIVVRYVA